ncbi:MAG: carbon-nitrogen hydrolase family protein [Actinobacteria bacterium]|nr:carbon-nitrogen hydrolase family protein [Actinomycetota bacterium]
MRVAAVQMTAGADADANVETAGRLVAVAAAAGATLVVLPEKWPLLEVGPRPGAQPQSVGGTWMRAARGWAAEYGVTLVAGSLLERDGDGERAFNTTFVVDPTGTIVARYRKLHLFDVDVEGRAYRESSTTRPGADVVTTVVDAVTVGLSICYDLRFPELYRALADRGADILAVPAAFTAATGRAHWELLVRSRAVENQAFVIAANQVGRHGDGAESYGHSMIVDPWGVVLADVRDGEGIAIADLDMARLADIRATLPALAHRRADVFPGATRPASGR